MATRDVIFELIEEYNHNPRTLLESLVASLPTATLFDHLEHISNVEDWQHKVNASGTIYDSEKEELRYD